MKYFPVYFLLFSWNIVSYSCENLGSADSGNRQTAAIGKLQTLWSSVSKDLEPVLQNVKQGGDVESIKNSLQNVDYNSVLQKVKNSDFGPTIEKFQSDGGSMLKSFMSNLKPQNRQKRKISFGCTFFPDLHHRY